MCVCNSGGFDKTLLGHLCTEVAAIRQAIRADDRECNVMAHASGGFGGKQIAARRLEELHDGRIFERGRVRQVDNDLSPGQRFRQPLACQRVDA